MLCCYVTLRVETSSQCIMVFSLSAGDSGCVMYAVQIKAELEDLKADAARLVDIQLTKTADTIKKEVEQQQAGLLRKLEASKGTKWAQMLQRDLQFMEWFDAQVAQDPANGPRAQA